MSAARSAEGPAGPSAEHRAQELELSLGRDAAKNPVVAAVLLHLRRGALAVEDGLCLLVRILESELRQEREARLKLELSHASVSVKHPAGTYDAVLSEPEDRRASPAVVKCDVCGGLKFEDDAECSWCVLQREQRERAKEAP